MIIDCIADLHGHYSELEGGDLLIVAGDLTARDVGSDWFEFVIWVVAQKYKKIIVIAGNHDNCLRWNDEYIIFDKDSNSRIQYLCDSGAEFEGLKIWGSPWTRSFEGMNPHCKAFTLDTEEELAKKWALIPDDVDILITHSPPYGILDKTRRGGNVGSTSLLPVLDKIRPKLHVYGHIHEGYGQYRPMLDMGLDEPLPGYPIFVNCSHANEHYEPVNKPIRIIL